jgi:hypothetical protein
MNRIAKRSDPQFMTRLPEVLHDRLKEAASVSGRSMNSELIVRLEASFSPQHEPGIPPLDAEVSSIINRHIDREVKARLRAIAANINGAAA